MLIEPSEQLCFETQLLLRLSLGFFFGERLLHIKDSLRKEAVVAQTNELGKLPAVQILGIPRPRLSPIKTVLVRSEKLFGKLFKNPCSQAELNKIVPFGFSLQRQKMVFFCHQNSIILLC